MEINYAICFANSRSGHSFIMNNLIGRNGSIKYKNFENSSPAEYKKLIINNRINLSTDKKIKVIVIRDLLNWLSSYYTLIGFNNRDPLKIWNNLVLEFFGETNFLGERTIKIIFDEFISNSEYREDILNNDIYRFQRFDSEMVPENGGGSSFDKMKFNGFGSKMDVLGRFKIIRENPDPFINILRKNDKTLDLYYKYFNISEEKEKILKLIKK